MDTHTHAQTHTRMLARTMLEEHVTAEEAGVALPQSQQCQASPICKREARKQQGRVLPLSLCTQPDFRHLVSKR